MVQWSQAVIGAGIFLFALRILHSTLSRPASTRLKPILDRLLRSPLACVGAGFALSVLVGSDLVALVGILAMLNASLTDWEQGYFAGVGAVSAGFVTPLLHNPLQAGGLFVVILILGILLMWYRRGVPAELLELVMILCVLHVGLVQVALALLPLRSSEVLVVPQSSEFIMQAHTLIRGFIDALPYQPAGSISHALAAGVSEMGEPLFVLGAWLGGCLILSLSLIEFSGDARRIVFLVWVLKVPAVLVLWFFLPYISDLLSLMLRVFPSISLSDGMTLGILTVAVLVSLGLGMAFSQQLLSLISYLFPSVQEEGAAERPPLVLRVLASSPERAQKEASAQLEQLKVQLKSLFDRMFEGISVPLENQGIILDRKALLRRFQNRCRSVRYLIFFSSKREISSSQELANRQRLKTLGNLEHLFFLALRVVDVIEQQSILSPKGLPENLSSVVLRLQSPLNEILLMVLAERYRDVDAPVLVQKGLDAAERQLLAQIGEGQISASEAVDWMHQLIADFRIFCLVLIAQLYEMEKE